MDLRNVAAAAAIVLVTSLPAHADPRDDALAELAKCAAVTDDHARLACYDAAAPDAKAALAAPPAQVAETREQQESWFGLPSIFGGGSGERPAQTTPQQFGNEYLPPPPPPAPKPGEPAPPPPPEPIDSITAGVSDYAFNPFGRFTVFLDNGQIWQQLEGDTDKARFKKGGPNSVTISRGAFGSYGLQVNDLSESYKVKRLK